MSGKLAWRAVKVLVSLPLLGLLFLGLQEGWNGGGAGVTAGAVLGLLALWAELIGWRRLEPVLPWLGLGAGLALIAGAPAVGALSHACTGRRTWLCQAGQMLAEGGPLVSALPWALLGAITVVGSVSALRRP